MAGKNNCWKKEFIRIVYLQILCFKGEPESVSRTLLVTLLVFMSGCATTVLDKPGAQPGDFERDKYGCELKLGYVGHAGGNQPTDQLADYLVRGKSETMRCMKMKGWVEVEEKKPDAETGQIQPREQAGADATAASSRGGKFGVVPAEVTPIIANLLKMDEVQGIMVTAVYADSVASRAGVKKGDVILKYGDKVVNTDPELRGAIRDTPPGTTVPITIWRNGSEIILSARF